MTYSPAGRLLTLLDVLQSRSRVSAAELADRLQVETRSVRRYMLLLQDMGIPVEARRGRYGGYRLRPGYKLPPLMLTDEEALALTLGLLTTRRLGFFGLADAAPAVESALAKIERVLPVGLRERAQAVQAAVALDPATLVMPEAMPPEYTPKAPARLVLALSAAARQGQRLILRYIASDGAETVRGFDCYGLVYHDGRWYAVGYCHLRQAIRTFRLDRIHSAKEDDASFTRPVGFDCLAYAIQAFAAWPDAWRIEALIKAPLTTVYQRAPTAFASLEEATDGVILRAYENDLDHAARFLVGLGLPFIVRQPPELHDALQQIADEIAATLARSAG